MKINYSPRTNIINVFDYVSLANLYELVFACSVVSEENKYTKIKLFFVNVELDETISNEKLDLISRLIISNCNPTIHCDGCCSNTAKLANQITYLLSKEVPR